MKRKQIYIEAEQERQLRSLAAARRVAVAVLIREALDEYLRNQPPPPLARPEDHPLWGIVGIIHDEGIADASINYKHYLYGAPKRKA